MTLRVSGIFAGIGGLELGFERAGLETVHLCESDPAARAVLQAHYPDFEIDPDVRKLKQLAQCDVVSAGFPCQDLSQVGRTRGIKGESSGLVSYVMQLLREASRGPTWLILENVPFMLRLQAGKAMSSLTRALDAMEWKWAYRTVDSRAFGLAQRRRRVILVASRDADPRTVLFADDCPDWHYVLPDKADAYGFYWTEGNTGLGWAVDAIPTLKGGSAVAIPSPPAIWKPADQAFGTPSIEDAERLQGFPAGWTAAAKTIPNGARHRWRLVGNAVSVPVAKWIGTRLVAPGPTVCEMADEPLRRGDSWPDAAWGEGGKRYEVVASESPLPREPKSLADSLKTDLQPLSHRAASGFYERLENSALKSDPLFRKQLKAYVDRMAKGSG